MSLCTSLIFPSIEFICTFRLQNTYFLKICTGWSVRIRSFSGPYFPALGLNTEETEYLSAFNNKPNSIKTISQKIHYLTFSKEKLPDLLFSALLSLSEKWQHKKVLDVQKKFLLFHLIRPFITALQYSWNCSQNFLKEHKNEFNFSDLATLKQPYLLQ